MATKNDYGGFQLLELFMFTSSPAFVLSLTSCVSEAFAQISLTFFYDLKNINANL